MDGIRATRSRRWCCSCLLMVALAGAWQIPGATSRAADLPELAPVRTAAPASLNDRLSGDLEAAIARVQPFLDRYGYLAVFLAVLVEGFGLVAPGQTLLLAAALMAVRGGLSISWVLCSALAAAILGNTLGYLLGRRGGRPLLQKLRVNDKHLVRLESYFSRYGPGLLLLARFFDGLRQFNGIVAGILAMPWKTFTLYNIGGAFLWTGVWGLGTYVFDKNLPHLHAHWRTLQPWIVGFTFMACVSALLYLRRPGERSRDQVG